MFEKENDLTSEMEEVLSQFEKFSQSIVDIHKSMFPEDDSFIAKKGEILNRFLYDYDIKTKVKGDILEKKIPTSDHPILLKFFQKISRTHNDDFEEYLQSYNPIDKDSSIELE